MTEARFAVLVEQSRPFMLLVARRRTRSWADAEDAVQNATWSLWQRAKKRLADSMPWAEFARLLNKYTQNAARDVLKAVSRRADHEDTYGVLTKREGLSPDQRAGLVEALERMPPEWAEALAAVYGEGARIRDVAADMGMTPEALKQKLYRFRSDVRSTST